MVSDFVFPGLGGIESHIYNLSTCLIRAGHKVVALSHMRGCRSGVRHMYNGMKMYYYDFPVMYENCVWADLLGLYGPLREICVREGVDIIHTHQTSSAMSLQVGLHSVGLMIPLVFTDHSLFDFQSVGAIHLNKLVRICYASIDAFISVSHTNKENLALRGTIAPEKIFVIPNALDPLLFRPAGARARGAVRGLLRFYIGGDGPKRVVLEEMRERHGLHDQVFLLGSLNHSQVKETLQLGHVFLNTSFTEAFCIGILEAACSGLLVISTNVGGVREVLPRHMILLADSTVESLFEPLEKIIEPTNRGKYEGFFRSGKRLSMKHVITYIASDFRNDRIWLRRTRNSRRQYHISVCIDTSSSMRVLNSEHNADGRFGGGKLFAQLTSLKAKGVCPVLVIIDNSKNSIYNVRYLNFEDLSLG
uniref:Phosphatidylinositol N-acetylglucosaminyltransferase subunit A-like n=1 Tax=Dermatophagoides pteronyssinus TaxID=6956 RepID=A0A6P6Y4J8_DERPT|nr:phosphatidylinositol N-acetylglucosaminyltransferase subunit A-like [Dermatophagoides pteronyssinus]